MRYNSEVLREKLDSGFKYSHKGTCIGGFSAIKGIYNDNKNMLILTKENGAMVEMEYYDIEKEQIISIFREFGQDVKL